MGGAITGLRDAAATGVMVPAQCFWYTTCADMVDGWHPSNCRQRACQTEEARAKVCPLSSCHYTYMRAAYISELLYNLYVSFVYCM